ncbi:MAG: pantetheine-phosphate adenylyltransferase [Prochlorococcus sp. SP3034]|nr:pantetheine-phosphate adenylyltransferase [Prochlorococcus sp. SP3034]|tara:strand:+ start:4385 stop:4867 length:483 start_codon:yes stop_codon:yes gene_type:complete
MKILYPGTFDPLTNGHLDLIERSQRIFGNVIVAVLENTSKNPTFPLNKRIEQINSSISHLSNIEVISYSGLTVDCAKDLKADLILRGLRAMSDFEYELQISHTNRSLNKNIETIFLSTDTNFSFLSSSLVKEVAKFNGEINHMVPPIVEEDLKSYFNKCY